MVIIVDTEKMSLPPPPPYASAGPSQLCPPPFPCATARPTFATLPAHILLYIVYQTLPQREGTFQGESKAEQQRKVLYWMAVSLRLVNRSLYIACMHVLRSTYLPAYSSLIRSPYSSDPFPLSTTSPTTFTSSSSLASPVNSLQRETQVLDLFLSLKVREDVWADDTELHLEREESFKDLFDLMQPRSRLEDLVRAYGEQAGIISVRTPATSTVSTPTTPRSAKGTPSFSHQDPNHTIPFSALAVSFSSRRAGIVLTTREGKRTIVEVVRERAEQLEVAAKHLVKELKMWLQLHHYQ